VQELLGHRDVTTTMIYLHVLNRGALGVKSPADRLWRTAGWLPTLRISARSSRAIWMCGIGRRLRQGRHAQQLPTPQRTVRLGH